MTACPDRAPTSSLGYCGCSLQPGHRDDHRCSHGDDWARLYPLAPFSDDEIKKYMQFETSPYPVELLMPQQHRMAWNCWCSPVEVGQDAWQHND